MLKAAGEFLCPSGAGLGLWNSNKQKWTFVQPSSTAKVWEWGRILETTSVVHIFCGIILAAPWCTSRRPGFLEGCFGSHFRHVSSCYTYVGCCWKRWSSPSLCLGHRFQFISFCLKSYSCTTVGKLAQLANLLSRGFWGICGKSSFLRIEPGQTWNGAALVAGSQNPK